jgi:gliding motility-associated-like protein
MLYVPNTFTPNANATNDMFFPKGEGIKDFEMRIFNRWGEQIFLTDKMERGWDGLYKGKPAQLGVYVYKIYYTNIFGEEGNLVGHVNLVR